ncbi:MAG: TRC40/GET3/ArsA family transport-energizing ATPase [Promethearchaeota archaeon]
MLRRLVVLGGKGGVGKSSISAATALMLSELLPDSKVLLVSFDIAHNLSDMFETSVGGDITKLTDNLWGVEPDVEAYAREYTAVFAEKTQTLMKQMPLVGLVPQLEEFIDRTFNADSIPLALKNSLIFQHLLDAEDEQFDYVVADFPPTGNMLALFEIPQNQVQVILKYSLEMFSQVKKVVRRLKKVTKVFNPFSWGKKEQEERVDEILAMMYELERRGERITRMMKERGSLRLVTIAEKPSFEEIRRGAELTRPYVSLDAIHVNRLVPEAGDCSFCRAQRATQQKYAAMIESEFSKYKIWRSRALSREPIGLEGLRALAVEVYGEGATADEILYPSPES